MQIKNFDLAYKKAKELGFLGYFCLPKTTWKETKKMFEEGYELDEESARNLQRSINLLLAPVIINKQEVTNTH